MATATIDVANTSHAVRLTTSVKPPGRNASVVATHTCSRSDRAMVHMAAASGDIGRSLDPLTPERFIGRESAPERRA
jgi:hypothetical protein